MKDDIQQRAVNFQSTVVFDESQFAEPIHEKADSRASGAHDLSQRFLADLGNHGFRFGFLAEVGHQQKYPRQPLFAGVE